MPFNVHELAPNIYHLQSGANSGLIRVGNQAIVIDAGLDDDAGKKIKKTLEGMNVQLAALILTHGHADHFGGAAYLRKTLPPFAVYAPPLEAAFIENPGIEGIFLSAGALPFDTLTGKFTLAQGCKVDHLLTPGTLDLVGASLEIIPIAGHSPNQIAVRSGEFLFSADAFLPIETLQKYPVPFNVHLQKALDVLDMLENSAYTFAPGHGLHLSDPRETIRVNRAAIWRVIDQVEAALRVAPADEGALTNTVCHALGDPLTSPVGYYLARATNQAALVYLYENKRARWENIGGKLLWNLVQ
jgi:glyoxylase-like metal-dependent hydrolase (beta-lactamase superfamily II)